MTKSLTAGLLDLQDSTTLFLESLTRKNLQVIIDSQSEQMANDRTVLLRVTCLFINDPGKPMLYCVSTLNRDELTAEEYCLLSESYTPIGKIFVSLNDATLIKKKNMSVSYCHDRTICSRLGVADSLLFRKSYDYWVGTRRIGCIVEYFNEESLQRI